MSFDTARWAHRMRIKEALPALGLAPRSAPLIKAVLVAMAHRANYLDGEYRAWSSVADLAYSTEIKQDSVYCYLDALQRLGLLEKTGRLHGRTRQIPEYRLVGVVARELDQTVPITTSQPSKSEATERPGCFKRTPPTGAFEPATTPPPAGGFGRNTPAGGVVKDPPPTGAFDRNTPADVVLKAPPLAGVFDGKDPRQRGERPPPAGYGTGKETTHSLGVECLEICASTTGRDVPATHIPELLPNDLRATWPRVHSVPDWLPVLGFATWCAASASRGRRVNAFQCGALWQLIETNAAAANASPAQYVEFHIAHGWASFNQLAPGRIPGTELPDENSERDDAAASAITDFDAFDNPAIWTERAAT